MEITSDLLKERLEKIKTIKSSGVPLYRDDFTPDGLIETFHTHFQEGKLVKAAGRMMTKRLHGKTAFADLKDESGRIQIYIRQDVLGEEKFKLF